MSPILENSVTHNSAIPKGFNKSLGIVEMCVRLCSNIGRISLK